MSSNSKRLGRKCDILIGLCDQELIAVVGEKNRNNDMSSLALRCQKKHNSDVPLLLSQNQKKSLFLIRHNNILQLACKYHYTVHISHGPLKLWKKKSQTNGILNANGIFSHSFANEVFLLLRDFHQAATLTKNAYLHCKGYTFTWESRFIFQIKI